MALGRFSCLESWCSAQNEVNASPAGSVLPRPGLAASRWPGAEGSCRHLFSHVSQRAVPVRGLVSWCEDPACSWGTQSPGDLAGPPPQDALVLTSCGAALCWLLRRPLVLRGLHVLTQREKQSPPTHVLPQRAECNAHLWVLPSEPRKH